MSTILKALRRLEDDKLAGATKSLDEAVLDPATSVQPSGKIGMRAAAGVMLLAGVTAVVWSFSGFWLVAPEDTPALPPTAVPAATAVGQVENVDTAENVDPVDTAAPDPETPVVSREGALPGSYEEVKRRLKLPPVIGGAPVTLARIEVLANPEETRRELQRRAGAPSVREDEPEPTQPSPAGSPRAAVVRTPARDRSSPKVVKVPEREQARVREPSVAVIQLRRTPGIALQEIIWHPNPVRRIAVFEVEGAKPERRSEGDEIAGFTVDEIGLSDVMLVRDGVALKRRIGVN